MLAEESRTRTVTYLENSDYEFTIYFIHGKQPGKTMMIMGGIQGDEPGGYLAADLYADLLLEKGNLIVVPRANFYTIKKNNRGINGDMNRKFGQNLQEDDDADLHIIGILKDLISKSDVLLNLHEGSGYYSSTYISEMRNPMRYGQSIIFDAETYTHSDGRIIDLVGPASRVINEINSNIDDPEHFFHPNNHDTLSDDTKHIEQRKSATYYALTVAGIPAFGLETSKSLSPIETKVRYQTLAINAFMREYEIIPEHPSVYLPTPQLDHLVINIIGNSVPFAVQNGTTLTIPAGSSIQVASVVANYLRGISLDIQGYGNTNDLGRVVSITSPTTIKVYKDAFLCGEVNINPGQNETSRANTLSAHPVLNRIEITISGKNMVVSPDDTLHIIRGDVLKIINAQVSGRMDADIRVNFVGFVGKDKKINDADDRGYEINTATDLMHQWSIDKSGELFRIEALYSRNVIGTVYVLLYEPEIEYLIIELENGQKLALSPGSVFHCEMNEKLTVLSIVSNIHDKPFINTYISQGPDNVKEITLPAAIVIQPSWELQFRRASLDLGSISFRTRG
ncbi:M14/M99 family metallopeptidase [bacterium]|nr:M14/M99 family metallopeptidase [bacterium]